MADSLIKFKVPECRLLLVGKTGSGKSATGNTILDRPAFPTGLSLCSVTAQTQCADDVASGRRLVLVDTPGFYDTVKGNELISTELIKIYSVLSPGFHALLFVMSPERFTKECLKTKKLFCKIFGPGVTKHTIIVVTGKDRLEKDGVSPRDFVSSGNSDFKDFLRSCYDRIFFIDNITADVDYKAAQTRDLFKLIDGIMQKSGGRCFTNLQFQTMKLYKHIGRLEGKVNVNKARQSLFKRISQRYGAGGECTWGPNNSETKRLNLTLKTLQAKDGTQDDNDVIIFETDDNEEPSNDGTMVNDSDVETLIGSSFLDKLVTFFRSLFRTLFDSGVPDA